MDRGKYGINFMAYELRLAINVYELSVQCLQYIVSYISWITIVGLVLGVVDIDDATFNR